MQGKDDVKGKGFFRAIKGFFSGLFRKRNKSRRIALNSRFGHLLENIQPDSDVYAIACEAVALCDEAVSVISQRLISIEKLKMLEEQLVEVECFENMSDEDSAKLKGLLENFISLSKDKNNLKYQITGFDSSLSRMETLEDDAPRAINDIRDAEEKQRIFKQDLGYLHGEKAELDYERETLVNGMDFIHKFTIGLVIVFGTVVTALVIMFLIYEINIFIPLAVVSVLVIVTVAMLYALRKRMDFDLAMNMKKQRKAVDMINTKNVVYAYYTNFLNYEYKKFKVKSADMLKSNLRDYGNYKYLTKRFDSIRNIMFQTEAEITRMMREYGIENTSSSLESFARTFSIEDKRDYFRNLLGQKKAIERELVNLDKRQEEIWDILVMVAESDKSEEKIIDAILQSYMKHVSSIIDRPAISRGAIRDLAVSEEENDSKTKDSKAKDSKTGDSKIKDSKIKGKNNRKKYKFIGGDDDIENDTGIFEKEYIDNTGGTV